MRLVIAADHAGFELKGILARELRRAGHQVEELGPPEASPGDDYPDVARLVGQAIQEGRAERGILICGSGVGASVAINKMNGLRAGLCHDAYSARQGVEHDDINVLCLGSRVVGSSLALELARTFLAARFSGAERHRRRLRKVQDLEERGRRP